MIFYISYYPFVGLPMQLFAYLVARGFERLHTGYSRGGGT